MGADQDGAGGAGDPRAAGGTPTAGRIVLPAGCLARFDAAAAAMAAEDAKPLGRRSGRVYSAGFAVVETFALVLGVADPSDGAAVRLALALAEAAPRP